jgi:hypothetical protein
MYLIMSNNIAVISDYSGWTCTMNPTFFPIPIWPWPSHLWLLYQFHRVSQKEAAPNDLVWKCKSAFPWNEKHPSSGPQLQFHTSPLLPTQISAKPHGNKKESNTTNPKKKENQNILPLPKWKMTARRVLSWHTLCTPSTTSISRIYSVALKK